MKVYQLMNLLEKIPAGADATVSMTGTLAADVVDTEFNDGCFQIMGGDAQVIDDGGDEIGTLSELSRVSGEKEEG